MNKTATDLASGLTHIAVHAPGLEPALSRILTEAAPAVTVQILSELDDWAQETGQGPLLLVRPGPIATLAAVLATTSDERAAIAAWVHDLQTLVRRALPMRRRLVLVDRLAFVTGDPVLHGALADRLGISLAHPDLMALPAIDPAAAQSMGMAQALIEGDARLQSLARQIDVLTQPSAQAEADRAILHSQPPETLAPETDTGAAADDPAALLRAVAAERDLLRAALASLLGEVDSHLSTIANGQAHQAQMRDALAGQDVLLADLASLQRRFGEAESARLHREDRIGNVLLDMGRQIEDLTATVEDRTSACQALEAELDRILRSKSWRVTAPLRATRRTLGRSE